MTAQQELYRRLTDMLTDGASMDSMLAALEEVCYQRRDSALEDKDRIAARVWGGTGARLMQVRQWHSTPHY